jgi:hypothetical protein
MPATATAGGTASDRPSAGAERGHKPVATRTSVVRGGWVNEAGCIPVGAGTTEDPDVISLTCSGGSIWDGELTGHTVVHVDATLTTSGAMHGTYEEFFVGTYLGDDSHGGLRTRGTVDVFEDGAFTARAAIVEGTCDWLGSTGSMAYDGFAVNGGYVGEWTRPVGPPASDPACNPVTGVPGFD